jgi:ABC-type lipoprotein release transport system permease subunit
MLFGVSTTDATPFAAVAALLAAVAFAATFIPAWRTTWVNRMVALREE